MRVVKGFRDSLDNLPRVKTDQAQGDWCSGATDGESFSPGVQSPVPPTRRSTLQSVNWSNKHRRVQFVLLRAFTFVLQLLRGYSSLHFDSLYLVSLPVLLHYSATHMLHFKGFARKF